MVNHTLFSKAKTHGNDPIQPGVAVTGTVTYYSSVVSNGPGGTEEGYGVQFSWTGTPSGVLTCWLSDKAEPSLTDDTDWVQDAAFVPTNPAGAAAKFRDDVSNSRARFKRFKYVNATGSGVLFADVSR